jgi:hypothetical protein
MLEETDGISSADVFITPPRNHDVSDEDSGEEDGGTVDNLNGNQLNAASTATVMIGTERMVVGGDDDTQSSNDGFVEDENSESESPEVSGESADGQSWSESNSGSSRGAFRSGADVGGVQKRRRLMGDLPKHGNGQRKICRRQQQNIFPGRISHAQPLPCIFHRHNSLNYSLMMTSST